MKEEIQVPEIIESSLIALASQFPVLSGVGTFYSDWKNKQETKNIKEILSDHASALERLKGTIDINYLKSNQYATLLQKTILTARHEQRESKRKLFSTFLTQSCNPQNKDNPYGELLLETLDKVEVQQLIMLEKLSTLKIQEDQGWTIEQATNQLDTNVNESRFHLEYMTSIGLISDFNHFHIDKMGHLIREKQSVITNLGKELLKFLRNDDNLS